MNDYELVIKSCKKLETLLESGFAASGKGLHQKVTSIESRLPPPLVKRLRFIATLRNKLVHETEYERLDDRAGFLQACSAAESDLARLLRPARRGLKTWLLVLLLGGLIAAALAYLWATR